VSAEKLVARYISSAGQVLKSIELLEQPDSVTMEQTRKVVESADAYFKDAKYYRDQGRFDVGLASIAYCEGLLDALKLLGLARFEWPKTR